MKKTTLLLAAGSLAGAIHLLAGNVPEPGAAGASRPRVTFDGESHDLGVVGPGEAAAHDFVVKNVGEAPLEISLVEAAKGSVVTVEPGLVAPGAEGRVRVSADTESVMDKVLLPVVLATNDPDRPRVTLELRLEVRVFLLVRPGYARYVTVQKAREGTIAQTLASSDGATFRLLKVEAPVPSLRLVWREARPEERRSEWTGSQWRIEATLASEAPVGALSGAIQLETDHPRQRRTRVPVSGFVRPIFAVTPPAAHLGDVDPKTPQQLSLVVKNFAEEEIEIKDVTSTVPAIQAVLEAVQPGRSWKLRLRISPAAKVGPFEGVLRLVTGSPKVPLLEVPVSGRIVRAQK
jgi:Protein of unknown function (DUF1573)